MTKALPQIKINNNTYTLLDSLGSGSQGSVWKVRRESDSKELAMKSVLLQIDDKTNKISVVAHFEKLNIDYLQREIEFVQSLDKPETHFIVPCLDAGTIPNKELGDLPVWIMPQYAQTLQSQFPKKVNSTERPRLQDCLKWIKQIATALNTLHRYSPDGDVFVHRDIKPANIMLTQDNDVRLIDFGGGKKLASGEHAETKISTPQYAAPEQVLYFKGEVRRYTGTHSDIYALGLIIYGLLTGKQFTQAQEQLADERTVVIKHLNSHEAMGLLGKIGGLEDNEYENLEAKVHYQLMLLSESKPYEGTGIKIDVGLPEYSGIATSFAKFVRLLLHANYKKRPTAKDIITWVACLENAIHPELDSLQLETEQNSIDVGTPLTIHLTTIGHGLSSFANEWLRISLNAAPLNQVINPVDDKQQQYGFLSNTESIWSIDIPASEIQESGEITIKVEATVSGTTLTDKLEITVKNSAIELWQKKRHKEALCIDLKEEWLDQIEKQAVTSLPKATQYLNLLTTLKKCHVDKQELLVTREESFNTLYENQRQLTAQPKDARKRKPFLKYILISLALIATSILLLSSLSGLVTPSDPNAKKIKQLQIKLQDDNERSGALRDLYQFVTLEDSALAKDVLDAFEKQSLQLMDSAKKEDQQRGLSRTEDIANQGSNTARKQLGKVYQQGKITDQDWGKAWDWYDKAGDNAAPLKAMLEKGADKTLHNKDASTNEKALAYQAVEKAAEAEPSGDPAQKWMEYYYRAGDGVEVDLEKAEYWRKRFDGEQE